MKKIKSSICAILISIFCLGILCGCNQDNVSIKDGSSSVQSKADIEQTDTPTQSPTVIVKDLFDFNEAHDVLEEFVVSGAYKEYIADVSFPDKLEYVIYDLNADDIPELLIAVGDPAPFFNTWLFSIEGESVVLVTEQYGYGQFRYSPEQNLIIGTPEFRPFDGTGYAPFYLLDGTNYENVFDIVQDLGVWYYVDGNERMEITEDDSKNYFEDAATFEWLPIENQ